MPETDHRTQAQKDAAQGQLAPCGLQCRRCGDVDGPFKGTGHDVLCEGCINRGGAW